MDSKHKISQKLVSQRRNIHMSNTTRKKTDDKSRKFRFCLQYCF